MKVLLDENMPPRLRLNLAPHDAYTVEFQGWKGLKNGLLVNQAEAAAFETFITVDKNDLPAERCAIETHFYRSQLQLVAKDRPRTSVSLCRR